MAVSTIPTKELEARTAPTLASMAVRRLDNIGIVFADIEAAVAFFEELGLEVEGRTTVEGEWSDRIVGLNGQIVDIAMMCTPDGHNKLELMSYQRPAVITPVPQDAPANTLGLRRLMFAVDDLEDTLARLQTRGAELVGEVVNYADTYLLCYLRGPEGVTIALAEELS
jgi:catechol 2,3-dioxygenase-like lactoylglutathione lyase family enzyme